MLRFLVDNALSPLVSQGLSSAGYDSVHVRDYGLQSASDEQIRKRAYEEQRIIISADMDFSALASRELESKLSLVLFRGKPRKPEEQLKLLIENLPRLEEQLEKRAIVVIEEARIRIRPLPL